MNRITRTTAVALAAAPLAPAPVAAAGAGPAAAAAHKQRARSAADDIQTQHLRLDPSSPQLATCMPGARIDVYVDLATDVVGFDQIRIKGRHLAPNRDYTVFLLEQA